MTSQEHPDTAADTGRGHRLRQAREAAGMTVAEAAAKLHMPVRVVESLESEDGRRLGGAVFARGQLRAYARLLGVPEEDVAPARDEAPIQPVELVPRTYTSPMRRFAEQAARRAVYVVITAVIAVPVWMAARPHLGLPQEGSAPLDAPRRVADAPPGTGTVADPVARARPATTTAQPARPRSQPPVVASMAPRMPPPPAISLRLLEGESWVQVVAADGRQIEEAVLRAGESREYEAGEVGGIVLGNASAVEVRHEGQVLDTAPYRRANVARFTVSSDGSPAPASN